MNQQRRRFLQAIGASGVSATLAKFGNANEHLNPDKDARRFNYIQVDVFSSHRLQGNPLAVFPDARGLSAEEMQGLARETNLQETMFVFPRDSATEQEHGIKVRIFTTDQEVPFAGHPTLGTAMVLRNFAAQKSGSAQTIDLARISLDLQVGKVPAEFHKDSSGNIFGEMHQIDPEFGTVHDRDTIGALLDLQPSDISTAAPIQSVSTGLPFIIVPIKTPSTLQRLTAARKKAYDYLGQQKLPELTEFYYVTRDTGDPSIGLRSRGRFSTGETPPPGLPQGAPRLGWCAMASLAPT